ncbi:MAG: YdcF family protein [Clostridia bacterium]|nr:YdcF family protein [Clostridia bacterium]
MLLKKYIKRRSALILAYIALALAALCVIGAVYVFSVNAYVKNTTKDSIITPERASELEDVDCIIVLGCFVKPSGVPSDMLYDRIKMGNELYLSKAAPKIIMSGDHGQVEYDEVSTMKAYAVDAGVPSEDIFCDHAGFSTYESIYRAKEIFGADKVIIVTQEYHLHRALYVAKSLGIDAYGVSADYRAYAGQIGRDLREILARNKDFITSIFKPEPTYLGESIPINGNGDVTNG